MVSALPNSWDVSTCLSVCISAWSTYPEAINPQSDEASRLALLTYCISLRLAGSWYLVYKYALRFLYVLLPPASIVAVRTMQCAQCNAHMEPTLLILLSLRYRFE